MRTIVKIGRHIGWMFVLKPLGNQEAFRITPYHFMKGSQQCICTPLVKGMKTDARPDLIVARKTDNKFPCCISLV